MLEKIQPLLPQLSQEEIQQLITELLNNHLKQPWAYPLMSAFNGVLVLPGVEALFFRRGKDGKLRVLLAKRQQNPGEHWPDQWAVPGSTPRNYDVPAGYKSEDIIRKILHRIWKDELGLPPDQFERIDTFDCGTVIWRHKRGPCASLVRLCVPPAGMKFHVGKFYLPHRLPKDLLGGHEMIVEVAYRHLLNNPHLLP